MIELIYIRPCFYESKLNQFYVNMQQKDCLNNCRDEYNFIRT